MATDLLSYWKLRERPFEATWDTRFFFQSRGHDEALNRLLFLVGEQTMSMGMLTGEIGCGKTLTRAVFCEKLDPVQFCVVSQENSNFGFRELLTATLRSLTGDIPAARLSKFALYEKLKEVAHKIRSENRHLVLLFDEAQEMSLATLNELKLLTNFNGGGQTYITLILLGQPELRQKIARLPAIDQRISLRFHLGPVTADHVPEYFRHRLQAAGHEHGELFTPEALERAFQVSRGIPRELNRLAKLVLEFAWLQELPQIDRHAMDAVVRDLECQQNRMIA